MFYALNDHLQETPPCGAVAEWHDLVVICTEQEARQFVQTPQKLPEMRSLRFCRAIEAGRRLTGVVVKPRHGSQKQKIAFVFMLWENNLFLIDNMGYCRSVIASLQQFPGRSPLTAGRVLCDMLDYTLKGDLEYLSELDDRAARLEQRILGDGDLHNADQDMMAFRKEVSVLANYYLQLADLAEGMQADTEDYFSDEEERRLKIMGERVNRLREEALMLREYAMQIREVYQAQIGIKQNEIMKFLTVVTSIFLPLTLIAGWYGMNFAYMPELHWRFGYLAVIGVSAAIAGGCILYFKHRKFW